MSNRQNERQGARGPRVIGSERAFSIQTYAQILQVFHVVWGRSSLVLIQGIT